MFAAVAQKSRIPFASVRRPPQDWLSDALDLHLGLSPRIINFRPDQRSEEKLATSSAPQGSSVRIAKLTDRVMAVVAVPDNDKPTTQLRRALVKHWGGKNLLVVSEGWLMQQPRLDTMQSLARFNDRHVSRTDWMLVEDHLLSHGGYSDLSECAAHVLMDKDPVAAVLALVTEGRLRIDYSRPLSASSVISLPVRRRRGRRVIGG